MTSTTTTGLILTACIALSPTAGAAQTSENSPTSSTAQQAGPSVASQHLAEAERLLNSIPQDVPNLKKDSKKQFSELRERFAGLVKAYQANGDPFVPAAVVDEEAELKSDKQSAPANWKMYFSDVEHDLAVILGGGSALPSSTPAGAGAIVAAAAPPVGTSGTIRPDTTPTSSVGTAAVVGEVGIKNLDPEVRRQLEQFRLDLELFFAATTMNLESEAAR